ncbi:MAG TPA: twin-arginine translocase TatA/TatE family subunit [Nitrospiraceae bacterium]|nr:twin-arginine translocase TatA/TatE family subunit [Nitrospiraceae bacterium]
MFEGLFQPLHLIIILAIALIIFGPGKLPQVGAGLGQSIREFKKALSDGESTQAARNGAVTQSDTHKEKA